MSTTSKTVRERSGQGSPAGTYPEGGGAVEAVLNLTGEHGNEPQYATRKRVVLPAPLGPARARHAPPSTANETCSRTTRVSYPRLTSEREERTWHYPPAPL